jgi:RNA polymerase sigma-70 factor (ECF subfamily)
MAVDELQAIQACQRGDKAQFGSLYELYFERVYKFIYYKTFHTETAEDLTSRTFIKGLENIDSFDYSKGSFLNWIFSIARNTVIDYYRQAHPHLSTDDVWDLSSQQDISVDVENRILLEKVHQYLEKLSGPQREVIYLRIWEGLSYKEVATILGKTEASCKMMCSRALLRMQQEIIVILLFFIINFFKI